MPIFEFFCQDCEQHFETLVLNRKEQVQCPSCHGEKLQKKISAHSVGSGMPDTACGSAPCSMPAPACAGGSCGACE